MLSFYLLAVLAGVAGAIEPGQNAQLSDSLESPLLAGVVSLAVSLATIALVTVVTGLYGSPGDATVAKVPWWAWFGGFLSAAVTLAQLTLPKKVGAAPFLGIIVTAGVVTSILLDHFGLVGFKVHPADAGRIAGGALMVAGVGLVARF